VRRRYNVDLSVYRRRFLARRLGVRMRARQISQFTAYGDLVLHDPVEYEALLDVLNINLSYFMRDCSAYDVLSQQVIPQLLDARRAALAPHLAVWSAGCANGEEPYSVAMLLHDALGSDLSRWRIQIDAVDRSATSLARAQRARYHAVSFQDIEAAFIARHFDRKGRDYVVKPAIRSMISWRQADIRKPPPLSAYDLILCRNVLIYYVRERQEAMVQHLLRYLAPGGYLMLGMAEMLPSEIASVGAAASAPHPTLTPVDAKVRIYRKLGDTTGKKKVREKERHR
jgi:chemotaxis protein methyltransferase CheR